MNKPSRIGYGCYGTESWRRASNDATGSHPPTATDEATGLELHVVKALGGLRLLVPAGTGRSMPLYSGPEPAADPAATVAAVCELGRNLDADAILLPGLWTADAEALAAALSETRNGWHARLYDDGVASLQPVGSGLDDMVGLIPKKERKPIRRRIRRLEEIEDVEIRTVRESAELDPLFQTFVQMHDQEWQGRGRQGHYVDWPEAAALHASLLRRRDNDCIGMISGVFQRGEPIALQLGFVSGHLASAINLARSPERQDLDQFSPATVAFLAFAGSAGEIGAEQIELGRGSYEYKRKLGATEESLRRLLLIRTGPSRGIRTGLSSGISKALHLLYYRLWFNRICPRVGRRPGPLWWPWRLRI